MLRDLWFHRSYIIDNALSDIRNRYAGSMFGALWNVLQPLAQILIFTFVFSEIMMARLPGVDSANSFAIYICAGLLPWGQFSEGILRGSNAFIESSTYLKKLPIPEHIFVAQAAASSSIILCISMMLLLIVVVIMKGTLSAIWLLLIPLLLLFMLMGFAIALIFGSINVFFRDTAQFLTTLLQVWMWTTPIVYPKGIVPDSFQEWFYYNPAYWFIDSLHEIIVFSRVPSITNWLIMLGICLVFLVLGSFVLRKLRSEIRDVL